jgi:hypothetical protein
MIRNFWYKVYWLAMICLVGCHALIVVYHWDLKEIFPWVFLICTCVACVAAEKIRGEYELRNIFRNELPTH